MIFTIKENHIDSVVSEAFYYTHTATDILLPFIWKGESKSISVKITYNSINKNNELKNFILLKHFQTLKIIKNPFGHGI